MTTHTPANGSHVRGTLSNIAHRLDGVVAGVATGFLLFPTVLSRLKDVTPVGSTKTIATLAGLVGLGAVAGPKLENWVTQRDHMRNTPHVPVYTTYGRASTPGPVQAGDTSIDRFADGALEAPVRHIPGRHVPSQDL